MRPDDHGVDAERSGIVHSCELFAQRPLKGALRLYQHVQPRILGNALVKISFPPLLLFKKINTAFLIGFLNLYRMLPIQLVINKIISVGIFMKSKYIQKNT